MIFAQNLSKARSFMKEKGVMFTNADEGNITVAMNFTDYRDRILAMLSDNSSYEQLNSDPSHSCMRIPKIYYVVGIPADIHIRITRCTCFTHISSLKLII